MAIRAERVQQMVDFRPVADELVDWLHIIQDEWNCKVISVVETKFNNPNNKQGFIILYDDATKEVNKNG